MGLEKKKIEYDAGYECNNNCICCERRNRKYSLKLLTSNENKSTDQCKKDLERIKKLGFKTVVFTGGETALRNDFFEIISFSKNLGFNIELKTNGRVFSNKEFCKKIEKCDITYNVFIYSTSEKIQNKLTRTESLKETLNGLKNLKSLDKRIKVTVPINIVNYKDLINTLRFLNSNQINEIELAYPEMKGVVHMSYFPEYSRIENHIQDIYEKIKIIQPRVKIKNIPYCFFGNRPIAEIKKFVENEPGIKISLCKKCLFDSNCPGINLNYLKLIGDNDFEPIK